MNAPVKQKLEFLLLFFLLGCLWYFGKPYTPNVDALLKSLEGIPLLWRGAVYVFLYVTVTFFLFFSKDVFWVAGALLFGAVWSTVFICIAEACNAVILFHLSRRFGRAYAQRMMTARYKKLDERLGNVHFLWLFLFRAAPLIPYRFMDLAAGLTRLSFRRYFAAALLGSWLKMYWIQFILTGVGRTFLEEPARVNPAALVDYFLKHPQVLWVSFIYVVFVVLVVVKIRKTR